MRTTCVYCGCGCGLYLGVRGDRVVSIRGEDDQAPATEVPLQELLPVVTVGVGTAEHDVLLVNHQSQLAGTDTDRAL